MSLSDKRVVEYLDYKKYVSGYSQGATLLNGRREGEFLEFNVYDRGLKINFKTFRTNSYKAARKTDLVHYSYYTFPVRRRPFYGDYSQTYSITEGEYISYSNHNEKTIK